MVGWSDLSMYSTSIHKIENYWFFLKSKFQTTSENIHCQKDSKYNILCDKSQEILALSQTQLLRIFENLSLMRVCVWGHCVRRRDNDT